MSCVGLSPSQQLMCVLNQPFANWEDTVRRGRWGMLSDSPRESDAHAQPFHGLVQKLLADLAHKRGRNSPEPNTRRSDPMLCGRVDAP